ncbi:hypothetical protein [Ktedonospora formicarum]|uniref:Uncharacterized protein n=1 Tax=Ktedonospora formicarum TaxID=2778364 RepID=A0A8J3MV50_9CHLR|nr:hypothetical protein [Ktedonospora formicarum]GHO49992.1 hypothetical protein KSX_81550 [Ktedonospora formicarum]
MERVRFFQDLFEHTLRRLGYLALPEDDPSDNMKEVYHALFSTAFHGSVILSLLLTENGGDIVLGRGDIPWEWALATRRGSTLEHDLPPDAARWMQLLAIEHVPREALVSFQRQMKAIHPWGLKDASLDAEVRDGMSARGLLAYGQRVHRFDLQTGGSMEPEQMGFFLAMIELAAEHLMEKELLSAVRRYLPAR